MREGPRWQVEKEKSVLGVENLWLEVGKGNHKKVVKWKPREEKKPKRERPTESDTAGRSRRIKVKRSLGPW